MRAGREFTDIDVLAAKTVTNDIHQLRALLSEAETLAESGKLMTLPAPAGVRGVRDWMGAEFIEQVQTGREPRSHLAWLAAHSN